MWIDLLKAIQRSPWMFINSNRNLSRNLLTSARVPIGAEAVATVYQIIMYASLIDDLEDIYFQYLTTIHRRKVSFNSSSYRFHISFKLYHWSVQYFLPLLLSLVSCANLQIFVMGCACVLHRAKRGAFPLPLSRSVSRRGMQRASIRCWLQARRSNPRMRCTHKAYVGPFLSS